MTTTFVTNADKVRARGAGGACRTCRSGVAAALPRRYGPRSRPARVIPGADNSAYTDPPANCAEPRVSMTRPAPIDLSDVSGCTCLGIRRIARRLTQAYDRALEKAELTVNQFGLLAKLYGASGGGQKGVPIGALAGRVGMHPTTLNRDLKALKQRRLVADASGPGDRRVRCVTITAKGCAALRGAIPLWRKAQTGLEITLGKDAQALSRLLAMAARKLESATARI